MRSGRQRLQAKVADLASRGLPRLEPVPAPRAVVAQPPEAVLDLLRQLGVAICRAGDAAGRVTVILDDVARSYAARGVSFFVLPTAVFVRIDAGPSPRVDFATGSRALRLDQIDALYRLIDDIRQVKVPVHEASERLQGLVSSGPRFGRLTTVVGTGVLTVGLGLMLNPTRTALPVYLLLGLLVGVLGWLADRHEMLELVFPVVTSFAVTWAAFEFASPLPGAQPWDG